MRRQSLFKASSSQNVCIFCASRFLGQQLRGAQSVTRRRLNTSRIASQSAGAAAAVQEPNNNNGNGNTSAPAPARRGFDPDASLSPSEQASRDHMRQQRLQAEAEQTKRRLQAEAEQKRRGAAEVENERRQTEELRQREREKAASRPPDTRRRNDRNTKEVSGEFTFRPRSGQQQQDVLAETRMREELQVRERNQNQGPRFQIRKQAVKEIEGAITQSPREERGQQVFQARTAQAQPPRGQRPQQQTPRMAMPSFGAGGQRSGSREAAAGSWGAGGAETKPLSYGEEAKSVPESQRGFDERWAAEPLPPPKSQAILFDDVLNTVGSQEETASQSRPGSKEQPPVRRTNSHAEHEYRATPFDSSNYQPYRPSYENDNQTSSWQHLNPRRHSEAPPPPPQQQQRQPRRWSQEDPAALDRDFEAYRTQRNARLNTRFGPPPTGREQPNPNISNVQDPAIHDNGVEQQIRRRCARCLEYGHTAKECTGPVRASCNYCGEVGHMMNACPMKAGAGQPRARRGEQSAREDVFGERRPPSRQEQVDAFGQVRNRFKPEQALRSTQQVVEQQSGEQAQPSRRFAEETQADEDSAEQGRRAKRSKRGFEDDQASAASEQQLPDRRGRRQSRRNMEREHDDAADEAFAAREERAAKKAERRAEKEAAKRQERARVELPDFISVSQLAQTLGVRYEHFVQRLERLGYDDVFQGKILNREISGMIAMEYDFDPVFGAATGGGEEEDKDLKARPEVDDKSLLPVRPPVVTIMGHVDHGKTTILDYLRKSSIAAGEAGGITQHIGAFSVPMTSSGKTITFLDTPGHAAFLAMRQRGANVTDLVILVVAADDSVKPQTLESIRCAREAGVPMIVAINKVDKEEADIQRVKQDLARNGVEIEDFGGDTQVVCLSGKTGQGMEELEEAVVTLSEILDHRAEMDGGVEGWVLEATTKKAGRVATVLVKRGTLRPGTVIVAGKTWARVRTLKNEAGSVVGEIKPGMPVEVDGWRDQPVAGDEVLQAPSEQKASAVVEFREEKEEREKTAQDMEAINEARRLEQEKRAREKAIEDGKTADEPATNSTTQDSGPMTIPFIIKADVSGSAEAVAAYIPSLTSQFIIPEILRSEVGPVHESDIELASAAQGHIIAFNLPPQADAKAEAEARGVKVLENNIIYRVLDDVKAVLEEKLPPIITQRVLGEAEISQSFEIGVGGRKRMWIAGCKVRNGVIGRSNRARVWRGGEKVYDGKVDSLKNVKKEVQEMRKGTECGMGFEEWEGFQIGDLVQTYEENSEKRRL